MSNIRLTGRLAKDGELRFTPDGKPVLNFSMSIYTGGSQEKGYKPSRWVSVQAWDNLATSAQEMAVKGATLTVEGQVLPERTYQSNGETKTAGWEIRADVITKGDTFRKEYKSEQEDEF